MDLELGQARQTFITESRELLQEMESALLTLEADPEDQAAINSLFRSAHTIKGSSGVLGIEAVEKFTHFVENLLSQMRDGEIKARKENIDLLLECRDHISTLTALAASGIEELSPEVEANGAALTSRLGELLGAQEAKPEAKGAAKEEERLDGPSSAADAWHISIRFGQDVLRSGMDPVSFLTYLAKLGEVVSCTTLFDSMPPVEDMDPESCYLGFEIDLKSASDKAAIEGVFEFVREDAAIRILPPFSRVASYVELISELPEDTLLLGEILVKGGALTSRELEDALAKQRATAPGEEKPRIGDLLIEGGSVHAETVAAAAEKQKKNQSAGAKEASTVRIDAAKLDALVDLVGELVISGANIEQHSARIADAGLSESASVMLRLVEEIRESTMKIRMVPIGETFTRFRRVVRDISRELGKDVDLVISGGDTELDKTVIEKIGDPLMHLVRNSADHGIEGPEERKAAGKNAKGTVRLNAFHDAGSIIIEVADDGKGLDRERIAAKALSAGLIQHGAQLTDQEVFRLIFEPGFSTAEAITKFSGRGVGMDVVKRNIEALRGTIYIESAQGTGTTIRIRLPLTMAIIDGFMVGVGGSPYIIPLDMVMECVELSEAERSAADRRSYINLRGEVLPYVRLKNFFNEGGLTAGHENIVIVQYGGHKIGLVVDELFGEVQTVIKSLGRVYRDIKGISGATILGNGQVALILDVPRLMQSVETSFMARSA
ncbi:MAG: chemotaxis protein CheA [Deltaproteobacteria bacterium]|nr:chemotaxis protein CheA [Deltaproteobacteria bacterium]